MSEWIDISVPLQTGMVGWPGDPVAQIGRWLDLERGDSSNLTTLAMTAHTGTHMDAPAHYIRDGAAIDALPIEAVCGPARVVAIANPLRITVEELERHRMGAGERVLFKTRNSERCWRAREFVPDFVHVGAAAARYLSDAGVRLVGIDYLSVGAYQGDGDETHRILLGAGVWILEGLDLSRVEPGEYELICLPLRLAGADGAPSRAMVRPLSR